MFLSVLMVFCGSRLPSQPLPDSINWSGSGLGSLEIDPLADSLRLKLLDLEIDRMSLEAQKNDFWHRLIPDVRISANVGIQQLVFTDPTTLTPYIIPRDAYRLSISLSLSEILDFQTHEMTVIQLEKLHSQKEILLRTFDQVRKEVRRDSCLKQLELSSLTEEASLVDELLKYHEMLFAQGETKFDVLLRVRLQALSIHRSIERLKLTLSQK